MITLKPAHEGLRATLVRWARDRDGASAIEFAIVAPVLLLLAFGIIMFSLYLTTWISVAQAAAEGARASVGGMDSAERRSLAEGRVEAVISGFAPLLDPEKVEIDYPSAGPGLFAVKVTYPVVELGLSAYAPLAPAPSVSPSRTVVVTTGGY